MKKRISQCILIVFLFIGMVLLVTVPEAQADMSSTEKLVLNYKSFTIQTGSKVNLKVVSGLTKKASAKIVWKSSNPKIASVSS